MPETLITQVGSTETDSNDPAGAGGLTDTLVITKPTGTVNGHVMIACIYNAETETVTPPAGWTQVGSTLSNATQGLETSIWRKVASGEGANYTWTIGAAGIWGGAISTFAGVDNTTPVHANNSTNTTAGTNPLSGPNVTTTIYTNILTFQATRSTDAVEKTLSASGDTEIADWGLDGGSTTRNGHITFRSAKSADGSVAGSSMTTSTMTNVSARHLWTIALTPAPPVDDESGTATESESITGTVVDTETGTGTESEAVTIPIADSDSGVGTEGPENIVIQTHHIASDTFNRDDETSLTVSSSGAVWTSA